MVYQDRTGGAPSNESPGETHSIGSCQVQEISIGSSSEAVGFLVNGFRSTDSAGFVENTTSFRCISRDFVGFRLYPDWNPTIELIDLGPFVARLHTPILP